MEKRETSTKQNVFITVHNQNLEVSTTVNVPVKTKYRAFSTKIMQ